MKKVIFSLVCFLALSSFVFTDEGKPSLNTETGTKNAVTAVNKTDSAVTASKNVQKISSPQGNVVTDRFYPDLGDNTENASSECYLGCVPSVCSCKYVWTCVPVPVYGCFFRCVYRYQWCPVKVIDYSCVVEPGRLQPVNGQSSASGTGTPGTGPFVAGPNDTKKEPEQQPISNNKQGQLLTDPTDEKGVMSPNPHLN